MPVFTNCSFVAVEVVSHLISQQFKVYVFIGFAVVLICYSVRRTEKLSSEKAFK